MNHEITIVSRLPIKEDVSLKEMDEHLVKLGEYESMNGEALDVDDEILKKTDCSSNFKELSLMTDSIETALLNKVAPSSLREQKMQVASVWEQEDKDFAAAFETMRYVLDFFKDYNMSEEETGKALVLLLPRTRFAV